MDYKRNQQVGSENWQTSPKGERQTGKSPKAGKWSLHKGKQAEQGSEITEAGGCTAKLLRQYLSTTFIVKFSELFGILRRENSTVYCNEALGCYEI